MQMVSNVKDTSVDSAIRGRSNRNQREKEPLQRALKAQLLALLLIVLAVASVSDGDLTAAPSAADPLSALGSEH